MADMEWVENIKKIVLQAIEAQDPCDLILGSVEKEQPLEIRLDQKLVLKEQQIILPELFTDHKVNMVLPQLGEVPVRVKAGLKSGERILLLQKCGGQQYMVIGRY